MAINQRLWTSDEEQYLIDSYKKGIPVDEITVHLGRGRGSISYKAMQMGIKYKTYLTDYEKDYIEKHMGVVSIREMANFLGRTEKAVKQYLSRNYGGVLFGTEKLHVAEIGRMLGVDRNRILYFTRNNLLKSKKVGRYRFVKWNDLFDFMEKNPDLYDATICEDWYFDKFEWFRNKKKEDSRKKIQQRWGAWI